MLGEYPRIYHCDLRISNAMLWLVLALLELQAQICCEPAVFPISYVSLIVLIFDSYCLADDFRLRSFMSAGLKDLSCGVGTRILDHRFHI